MIVTLRSVFLAVAFFLAAGAGTAATLSAPPSCRNNCQSELATCLQENYTPKQVCYREYRACVAECLIH